ncbi:MAG: tetratricopeptide repeat protein [Bacteroidetes bacterium]|nr:tetratricopeptide repeat protein [Bacteroidota bacterium]
MAKFRAPKGVLGQGSQRAESRRRWYTPLLVLYYGNRRILTGAAIGVIVIIAVVIGFNYIQGVRDNQAQELLGAIVLEYEGGANRVALDGSGETLGLLDIIDQYGGTPAGNTARFYAGNAHFELEEYDQALEQFEKFDASNDFIGASATAGRAAVHELQGDFSRAAALFERAADMDDNSVRSPHYLRSAVRAYMAAGEFAAAEEVILEVKERYPETTLTDEFDFMLGFARARKK